jgi:putative ABC transport system permease protein
MIRHAFKLIWNRRRANGLILVELTVSFLVLCAVLTVACYFLDNWRRPLGFTYERVWQLSLDHQAYFLQDEDGKAAIRATIEELHAMLRSLPEIEAVSPLGTNVPFSRSTYGNSTYLKNTSRQVQLCEVSPPAIEVLDFTLLAGRWLEPGDESLNWIPAVVTRNLARDMFGNEDPVGQPFVFFNKEGEAEELGEGTRDRRIIGVVADYRRYGEFSAAPYAIFIPPSEEWPTRDFVLRIEEGVTAAFEEDLLRAAHGIAPSWSFTVTSLEKAHTRAVREVMLPLMIGVTVAGFLITMAGMGLVGVLWQNVTRRTRELGLRRALGATSTDIRHQVLVELWALTTIAVGAGSLVFVQIPILRVFGHAGSHVFLLGLALSLAIIYLFSTICGAYPSWLATRVNPVEALQYE